jgi:alpha/beta superfamily hydrolase
MMLKSEDHVGSAARVDERTGIRETAGFFGSHQDKLFGIRLEPAGQPKGAVVICSALHADFSTNYRKEVLASRALAERGIVVQRFHYRGVGNSDGESRDVTLATLSDDVRDARAAACSDLPDIPTAFLATRLGALAAAPVVRENPGAPLAMWEPTLSGEAYTREALRALRVKGTHDDADGTNGAGADFGPGGIVDVMGYALHASFAEDISARTLDGELGSEPRPLMIVQLGSSEKIRRPLREFANARRSRGSRVDVHPMIGEEPWWFTSAGWIPVEQRPTTRELLEVTTGWLTSSLEVVR